MATCKAYAACEKTGGKETRLKSGPRPPSPLVCLTTRERSRPCADGRARWMLAALAISLEVMEELGGATRFDDQNQKLFYFGGAWRGTCLCFRLRKMWLSNN
ncbi:hypothetical protein NL676_020677 [Syzygium grande]|nr:hypothetical protein NL676_020677 [Syzygium grande]